MVARRHRHSAVLRNMMLLVAALFFGSALSHYSFFNAGTMCGHWRTLVAGLCVVLGLMFVHAASGVSQGVAWAVLAILCTSVAAMEVQSQTVPSTFRWAQATLFAGAAVCAAWLRAMGHK